MTFLKTLILQVLGHISSNIAEIFLQKVMTFQYVLSFVMMRKQFSFLTYVKYTNMATLWVRGACGVGLRGVGGCYAGWSGVGGENASH